MRCDRSHFAKIAAASFDFEAVYVVNTTDYARHMDVMQEINLELVEAFEKGGIPFAYPAQRLYLEQQAPVQSQLVSKMRDTGPDDFLAKIAKPAKMNQRFAFTD